MIVARILFWLAVWLGGLSFAGQRYSLCRADEGSFVPGCDTRPEYLAWVVAVLGMIMLARNLMALPFLRKWLA
jgi:hypothetical protein